MGQLVDPVEVLEVVLVAPCQLVGQRRCGVADRTPQFADRRIPAFMMAV